MNTVDLMQSFYTRDKANEGIEFPLHLPTGKLSEHSLRILGVDSDRFRDMDTKCKREIATSSDLAPEKLAELYRELQLKLIACLVISWSFDLECTLENVTEFLRNAPQIADSIDRVASKRSLFFGKESSSSSSLQRESSDSNKNQKAPSKRSAKASSKSTKRRV